MITPISIINPINDTTFKETLVIASAKNPPVNANGNEKIIMQGFLIDSNKHAIIPNNKKNEIISAIAKPSNASDKYDETPPIEYVYVG